jgi:hypothetical protein
MFGKKILAGIFAALVLIKVAFLLVNPEKWLAMAQTLAGYTAAVMVGYLIVLGIVGYFMLTSIDLIDVAVAMLFTGLLVGLTLIPYAASLQAIMKEFAIVGLGKAWIALIIWVAIAVAVFYRVFTKVR